MRSPTRPVVKPRWGRVSDACQMSGIGTTKFYELINTGRVRSILLDGKRLVDLDSIENLDVVAATPPAPGSVAMRRGGPGRPRKGIDAVGAAVAMVAAGSDAI